MKTIKLLLVLILALIPVQSAFAASQKTLDHYIPMDIDDTHWAYEEMDDFINADIIDGFMDEDLNMTVQPENKITRAQFVKILVTALGLKAEGTAKSFKDVKASDWFYGYVRIASSLGIVNGIDASKFAPNANITRDQMTKILVLAFEKTIDFPNTTTPSFTDVNQKYWAFDYINKAAAKHIVNGFGATFKPKDVATRAQAIVMIHRALQQEQSNLPTDEEITTFLKNHILSENRLVEANDTDGIIALYKENATGFYGVEGDEMGGTLFPHEEGEEFHATIDDTNIALQVLSKSDKFVVVEVTGMVGTFSIKNTNPSYSFEITTGLDGAYYLKKELSTGKWKIYYNLPYMSEE